MTVHGVAREGFAEAERYERARPGYPPEAVSWLVAELGIGPGSVVVDLAAGTGKLTRLPYRVDCRWCERLAGPS